jgi:RNA polymerase sigma-70 factor (ECF subfamily)
VTYTGPRGSPNDASFSTTQWSLVLTAGDGQEHSGSSEALALLCERYWYPIYALVRGMRHDPDTAQDLTQGFFVHLLETRALKVATPERGRFRAFLKTSLRHYLSNERHRLHALKRGGGIPHVSLDFGAAENRFRCEPAHGDTPEILFEKAWAWTILGRALERLRADANRSPESRVRFVHLEPFLAGPCATAPSYLRVAAELHMSESAVKVAVHRLRGRFGEELRAEIAETVDDPGQVEEEIRYLLSVVRPSRRDL